MSLHLFTSWVIQGGSSLASSIASLSQVQVPTLLSKVTDLFRGSHPQKKTTSSSLTVPVTINKKSLLAGALFSLVYGSGAYPVPAFRSEIGPSVLNPFPPLNIDVGQYVNLPFNIWETFHHPNPDENLILSAQMADGSLWPHWLTYKSSDPQVLGALGAYGFGRSLVVQGNYTYMLSGYYSNFLVIDRSVDSLPHMLSTLVYAYAPWGNVEAVGDYVFSSGANFNSIDVSNPAIPRIVDSLNLQGSFGLKGHYAYVHNFTSVNANNRTGLAVVDITNPYDLKVVNQIEINFPYPDIYSSIVKIKENYAYMFIDGVLLIVNVTDPVNLNHVSSCPVNGAVTLTRMDISRGFAYFSTTGSDLTYALSVVNTTDKSSPFQEIVPTGLSFYNLLFLGDLAYSTDQSIQVFNFKNPLSPVLESSTLVTTNKNDHFVATDLKGNRLFATGSFYAAFDVSGREFIGRPTVTDRGFYLINITAEDSLGNKAITPLAINVGSIVVKTIPNQTLSVGSSFLFSLDPQTFDYPNSPLNVTATLFEKLTLPSWLQFDPLTLTFYGTPRSGDQNVYKIQVNADNGYGKQATTTFYIEVMNRPPVLEMPLGNLTAYSNVPFEFIFPADTFEDLDLDTLSYRAQLVGTTSLPGWLSLDSALRKFYGIPFGMAQYQIQLIAEDGYGGEASTQFTITVPNSPPIVLNRISSMLANVGIEFMFTLNTDTFEDLDQQTLTLTTTPLPPWLQFDPSTRTFSGIPGADAIGITTVVVTATDPYGESVSTDFDVTVLASSHAPPIVSHQIPDQTVTAQVFFSFTFSEDTFADPSGSMTTFRYEATLDSGPLPAWMLFNGTTRTFSGVPPEPQNLNVLVRAYDPLGAFAIDTFGFKVVDPANYPPIVLNPLADSVAEVSVPYIYKIPDNTFLDVNGDPLQLTVSQAGGLPLPDWLHFNQDTHTLSGTPDWFDTDAFARREHKIEVFASDGFGSAKTTFTLYVTGESFWSFFLKTGLTVGSVSLSAFGVIDKRHLIWNYFFTKKYRKEAERIVLNEPYQRIIHVDKNKIREVRAFQNDHPLAQGLLLPEGLVYTKGKIEGTPLETGKYTIRIIGKDGRYLEEFVLLVKESLDGPDPEDPPSYTLLDSIKECWPKRIKGNHSGVQLDTLKQPLLSGEDS